MSRTPSRAQIQRKLTMRAAWLKAQIRAGRVPDRGLPHVWLEKKCLKHALELLDLFDRKFYDDEFQKSFAAAQARKAQDEEDGRA